MTIIQKTVQEIGCGTAVASRVVAAKPEWPCLLGSNAAIDPPLAPSCWRPTLRSPAPPGRHDLRQEPDAGYPLVRIRGGVMGDHDP
jgi:hypothetical protein